VSYHERGVSREFFVIKMDDWKVNHGLKRGEQIKGSGGGDNEKVKNWGGALKVRCCSTVSGPETKRS